MTTDDTATPSPTETDQPLMLRSVRLPVALAEEVDRLADRLDRGFSWLARTALAEYLRRSQTIDSLEMRDPDGAEPACRFVERQDAGAPALDVIVEGVRVPGLQAHVVTGPTSTPDYTLTLDGRFSSQVLPAEETWRWAWFVAQAMAAARGYTSHGPNSQRVNPHGPPEPLVHEWTVADEAGMCGHTYEATVTFGLPPVGDHDDAAYNVRDALVKMAYAEGARDVVTRLVSLTGMQLPKHERSATVDVADLAELHGPNTLMKGRTRGERLADLIEEHGGPLALIKAVGERVDVEEPGAGVKVLLDAAASTEEARARDCNCPEEGSLTFHRASCPLAEAIRVDQ